MEVNSAFLESAQRRKLGLARRIVVSLHGRYRGKGLQLIEQVHRAQITQVKNTIGSSNGTKQFGGDFSVTVRDQGNTQAGSISLVIGRQRAILLAELSRRGMSMADETSASNDQQQEFERLEAKLKDLLRDKYKAYWHAKGTPGEDVPDVATFQGEIKEVFDAIRLIDKKYKLPAFSMYEN